MIHPSLEEFQRLSRRGNLVAIRSVSSSDLETPVSSFLKLARNQPNAFLLESAEQEERIGRYSFLGLEPELVLFSRAGRVYLQKRNQRPHPHGNQNLTEVMRGLMTQQRLANPEGLPNFSGGFVGFLGYENVQQFERIQFAKKKGLGIEDAVFFLVKDFLLFDHFKKTLSVISICQTRGEGAGQLKRKYARVVKKIHRLKSKLERGTLERRPAALRGPQKIRMVSNFSRREFENGIKKIKSYVRAGDCIQVVFSQRLSLAPIRDDFEIYRSLRSINPSPYMFYFRFGRLRLIGSSPELLVKKTGGWAEVRPIAGTRPRGLTPAADARLEENLRRSVKERAEHLMLVDLGRNDLGRVCDFKTVKVRDYGRVERYSHVMHLVSTVTGRLRRGKDAFDLLKATFPAGTVTGAPKIRAMQIIDELEPEPRGPYAGTLGYFSFNQDMDMCITIRTVIVLGDRAYVQAGAGVVYDSQPRREYEETLNKAKALVQAIQDAHRKAG